MGMKYSLAFGDFCTADSEDHFKLQSVTIYYSLRQNAHRVLFLGHIVVPRKRLYKPRAQVPCAVYAHHASEGINKKAAPGDMQQYKVVSCPKYSNPRSVQRHAITTTSLDREYWKKHASRARDCFKKCHFAKLKQAEKT
jgi:hypothetical protein